MFAFAIWDARAARAVAGARPHRHQAALLLGCSTSRLAFGSEIKALLADPRAAAARRRRVALPLPLVPRGAGAADALRRHPKLDAGTWLRVDEDGTIDASSAGGTPGTTSSRSTGVSDGELAERVLDGAAHVGRAAEDERRPRRRLPLRRHRLVARTPRSSPRARRRPVQTFSIGYDADYASLSERAAVGAADGRARSAPSTTSASSRSTTCSLPARDGAAAGRADRRPGLRSRSTTSRSSRGDERRHRRAGRRGRRRALLRLSVVADARSACSAPTTCRCRRAKRAGLAALRAAGRDGAAAVRVPASRRRRAARLLGRRRGVHGDRRNGGCSSPRAAGAARRPDAPGMSLAPIRERSRRRRGSPRT